MSKIIAGYTFTGMEYIRPNYDKPESDGWSKNWMGYLTPRGTYWNGTEYKPLGDHQVSVIKVGDEFKAQKSKAKPQYGWYGVYSGVIGGPGRFLQATATLLNSDKIDFESIADEQEALRWRYRFTTPVKVCIFE